MSDDKDIQSFITAQPSFHQAISYAYEPIPGDTICHIIAEADADLAMNKCARKWALRFVEGEAAQKKLFQQMETLTCHASETTLEVKIYFLN